MHVIGSWWQTATSAIDTLCLSCPFLHVECCSTIPSVLFQCVCIGRCACASRGSPASWYLLPWQQASMNLVGPSFVMTDSLLMFTFSESHLLPKSWRQASNEVTSGACWQAREPGSPLPEKVSSMDPVFSTPNDATIARLLPLTSWQFGHSGP